MRESHCEEGSITIEALLIIPIIIVVLVLFIEVGKQMYGDLQPNTDNYQLEHNHKETTLPADWIRQTDLLLDWGRGLKELLPKWS